LVANFGPFDPNASVKVVDTPPHIGLGYWRVAVSSKVYSSPRLTTTCQMLGRGTAETWRSASIYSSNMVVKEKSLLPLDFAAAA
jgi:hypothetical protein